jgi:hypothetical protein
MKTKSKPNFDKDSYQNKFSNFIKTNWLYFERKPNHRGTLCDSPGD